MINIPVFNFSQEVGFIACIEQNTKEDKDDFKLSKNWIYKYAFLLQAHLALYVLGTADEVKFDFVILTDQITGH